MTQQPLLLTLAARVAAWAEQHDGATFDALCEAMRVNAGDVDVAVVKVGALRWGARGYEVCRPKGEE